MQKTVYKPNVIIHMYDGRVCTGEEFLANPLPLSAERLQVIADDYAIQVDPRYRAAIRAQKRFERTEARRLQLEQQQAQIQKEMAQL